VVLNVGLIEAWNSLKISLKRKVVRIRYTEKTNAIEKIIENSTS
jgi:hypothetical protein